MITRIGNFLIDQWLWHITWDVYHASVLLFTMTLFFRFFLRINSIESVLISLGSIVISFATYTLFVVGGLMYIFKFSYQEGSALAPDPLHACIYVGIMYSILQTIFFVLLNHYYPIAWKKMALVAVLCNGITALVTYIVLPNPLM